MNIETYRSHCLQKKGVTEEFPFDNSTLVYKVMGKIFTLANMEPFESINLKCNPELALQLRERYPGVTPGYHMNKKHWNTISTDGSIPDRMICQWIDLSYALVVSKLSKKDQQTLGQQDA
ncbi:MAG: MmcQ/YjbR family DNA-binding protein [Bacteroidota bacterium]